jgi:hypothetical protein
MTNPYPASPSRPPSCSIKFECEGRMMLSTWTTLGAARAQLTYLGVDPRGTPTSDVVPRAVPRLKRPQTPIHDDPNVVMTPNGVKITSPQLAAILASKDDDWPLPPIEQHKLDQLRGVAATPTRPLTRREQRAARLAAPHDTPDTPPSTPHNATDDRISLQHICDELGVHPRQARAALRAAHYPKPSTGWTFAADELDRVKSIIKS